VKNKIIISVIACAMTIVSVSAGESVNRKGIWSKSCRTYLDLALRKYGYRTFSSEGDRDSFIIKSCDNLADDAEKRGVIKATVSPAMSGCATLGDNWKNLIKGDDNDSLLFVAHYCANL